MLDGKYIVGILGGSGSGKTALLRVAEGLGMAAVDCDAALRTMMRPPHDCYNDVAAAFPQCVDERGLDRAALARTVFTNPVELLKLERITHAYVERHVRTVAQSAAHGVAVDGAVLHKSALYAYCDCVVFVYAPRRMRLGRIMRRDKLTRSAAVRRLNAQPSDKTYTKYATHILRNTRDRRTLYRCAARLLNHLMDLSHACRQQ